VGGDHSGILGLALDRAGYLYVAEPGQARVLKVDLSTGVASLAAGGGDFCSYFSCDPGDFITTSDPPLGISEKTYRTSSLTISTGYLGDGGPATSAFLNDPQDVAIGNDGNIYIAEGSGARIRMVDTAGKFGSAGNIYTIATGFTRPKGIALDNDDNIYVADSSGNRIYKIDASTGQKTIVA